MATLEPTALTTLPKYVNSHPTSSCIKPPELPAPGLIQQTIRAVSSSNNSDRSVQTSQVKLPTSQAATLNHHIHSTHLAVQNNTLN